MADGDKSEVESSNSKCKYDDYKLFNDPVHGNIRLHPLLVKIIDTPQFQRLRNIKQLGLTYFVYPGASHNRFEHSIGTAHLAGKLVRILMDKQEDLDIDEKDVLCVEMAGLCHDLGHGPFSHVFESGFLAEVRPNKKWQHERASLDMFDYLRKENDVGREMTKYDIDELDITFIKEMIYGPLPEKSRVPDEENSWPYEGRQREKSFLYEIVSNKSNKVDVDKWDYMARDCHHLGIHYSFDHLRFMENVKVLPDENGQLTICARDKEGMNLYEMFHTRSSLHRSAYQHKVCKALDAMVCDAMVKADQHLLITYEDHGKVKKVKMSEAVDIPAAYMKLTDDVFWRILHSTGEKLKPAREILFRIIRRELYVNVGEVRVRVVEERSNQEEDGVKQITESELESVVPEIWQIAKEKNMTSLEQKDLKYSTIRIDYGMGDKNPVQSFMFYKKKQPCVAIKRKFSPMLPHVFQEHLLIILCKDALEAEDAQECFKSWCDEKGYTPE